VSLPEPAARRALPLAFPALTLAVLALGAAGFAHELTDLPLGPYHPLIAAAGAACTVLGAGAIVLRWRRHGTALLAERAFHGQALDSLQDAVVAVDTGFLIRAWNRAAEQMYGYSAAEVVGRSVAEVLPTELPGGGGIGELVERVAREGCVETLARRRRRDGSWFDVEVRISALRGPAGPGQGYVGVHRDVTERRLHEEAIRAAEAQIQMLTSRAPAGLFHLDAQGRVVFVNDQLCALAGMPPDRLTGGGWVEAVHPEDRERVREAWRAAWRDQGTMRAEFRLGESWVFATVMTLHDDEGRKRGVAGAVADVTEAHRLQDRLAQAERLASLGKLASGMAHEINNPLASVSANLSFAAGEVKGRPELGDAAEALEEARVAAGRVARIVRELQAFAAVRDAVEPIDLREAVRAALRTVPEPLQRRARVELELGAVPPVVASMQQAQRVLQHLLVNAFQAVPEERLGAVRASTATAADGRAVVQIEDDGRGIADEDLKHVFEPFFTTRKVGDGAGLGLTVCHGLVAAMSGAIEVESALGQGSRFRVLLPPAAR
jgi:PAS domain S-box-containing protein